MLEMIANPFINLITFLFLHSTILVRTCDISCNASQCMRIAESRTHFRENVEHCIIASKSCVRTARIKTQASGRWIFLFRALLLRGCLLSQERCVRQLEGVGSDAYVHGFVIICRWRPWNPGHRVLDITGDRWRTTGEGMFFGCDRDKRSPPNRLNHDNVWYPDSVRVSTYPRSTFTTVWRRFGFCTRISLTQ